MRGGHLVQHYSQTQATVALSSGEAELQGICKGASKALGLQSLARDLGIDLSLNVVPNTTAAIGICRRRGLGRIRHLAVADLWVQDRVRAGDFCLTKVKGAENPADCLTKYVGRKTLVKHLSSMNLSFCEGRAESAPTLTHAIFPRVLPARHK